MSKVKRFSLEERYGYQNRKVIYDKNADNDIELNNIYPIIDLLNQLDKQITYLQHRLEVAEKALELACSHIPCEYCPNSNGADICYIAQDIGYYQPKQNCIVDNSYYFKLKAEKELKGE